jgi:serine/threonine-protein kinase
MGVEDQGEKRSGTRAFGTPEPQVATTKEPGHSQGRPAAAAATPAPVPAGTGAPAGTPGRAPPTAPTQISMREDPQGDPLVGQTLAGRYQIERKLGEGGMGAVYLGLHVALEKRVALKVLHGEFVRKPDLIERFLQEAKAASKIRHENVIDITDFGQTDDGLVFFAMELLDGRDLAEELGHAKIGGAELGGDRLPWERSRFIFLQICAALSAAHKKGIIHRDLKPENIYLVERLGQPDFVKLLDFGIAKLTEVNDEGRKLTKTGMLFGTPEYMSPEQARGEKVDHRVDVYAMGCILYQMICGHVPFEADNFMGILTMHLTQETPLMGPKLAEVGAPPGLEHVVQTALAKEKDHRYRSIDELVADILALDDGLSASFDPVPQRAGSHADTSGAVRAPARTQWTGSVKLDDDAGATAAVPAHGGASKNGLFIGIAVVAALAIGGGIYAMTRGGDDAATASDGTTELAGDPGGGLVEDPNTAPVPHAAEVKITIQSEPRGADIRNTATDEIVGKTPKTLTLDKSTAPILFVVELDGYEPYDLSITPDDHKSEQATLEKLSRGSSRKKDRDRKKDDVKKDDVKKDDDAAVKDFPKKDDDPKLRDKDDGKTTDGLKSFEDALKSGNKKKPGDDL